MVAPYLAPLLGSLVGGGLGGLLGGGKRTGTGRASVQAMDIHERSFRRGIENFANYKSLFMQQFGAASPVYNALQSRVLGDLNDTSRDARLEQALMDRIGSQQAASGVFRSPSAALRRSFAGLQFSEGQRQQAFQNAFGFQQSLGQPLALTLLGLASPNLQGQEFALQGLGLQLGARSGQNQAILGGLSSGLGFGSFLGNGGFGGGGGGGVIDSLGGGQYRLPSGGIVTLG